MPIRQLVISAADGMHARPVADLARLARAHPDPVTLTTTSGVTVDVGSVLAVMDLALSPGDAVRMETAASAAAEAVLDAMTAILDPHG
ncbi:MAG: HPr family phosphocarrier protein [Microbacteriaceae bacterium]